MFPIELSWEWNLFKIVSNLGVLNCISWSGTHSIVKDVVVYNTYRLSIRCTVVQICACTSVCRNLRTRFNLKITMIFRRRKTWWKNLQSNFMTYVKFLTRSTPTVKEGMNLEVGLYRILLFLFICTRNFQ